MTVTKVRATKGNDVDRRGESMHQWPRFGSSGKTRASSNVVGAANVSSHRDQHDFSVGGDVSYHMTGPNGDLSRGWWHIAPSSALPN